MAIEVADEKRERFFVIPVRLDESNIPEELRKFQWFDLFESSAIID